MISARCRWRTSRGERVGEVSRCSEGPHRQRHRGLRRRRQMGADRRRRRSTRRPASSTRRRSTRPSAAQGGGRDRDRRHGLPRRARRLELQLARRRGSRSRLRVRRPGALDRATPPSSRRAATLRSSSACTRWRARRPAFSTTPSPARTGTASPSTVSRSARRGSTPLSAGTGAAPCCSSPATPVMRGRPRRSWATG